MKLNHTFIAAGLLCFTCGFAVADDSATQEQFKKLDTDMNGSISIEEATGQTQMLRNWTDIDKNKDGVLEMSEFSAFEASQDLDLEVSPD